VAREIEERIRAMELQRRTGTSPADKSTSTVDAKSRLAVPDIERATGHPGESVYIEQFDETIELGDGTFNAVKLSCPQSGMS
jgi:hypothetical protein